ncbi:MAG: recombinase family protein [Bacilli bacterium]
MEKLNVWIHCRVLAESSRNLLNYQEQILIDEARENDMRVIGVTKEIYHGKNLDTYGFREIISHIKRGKIDVILVYSEKRISIYEDVVEEFTLLYEQYNVRIVSLKDLKTNFLFGTIEL